MKKDFTLSPEAFNHLLEWLSAERDEAGEKYEEIRNGLIRFFRYRGCPDPSSLADETINRVAAKISENNNMLEEGSVNYFYGFAINVYHEYYRMELKKEVQLTPELPFEAENSSPENENKSGACLEECMAKLLQPDEKKLILKYYSKDKSAKFELRKNMAEKLGINVGTLHTRVHRIKNTLKKCIENCINEK